MRLSIYTSFHYTLLFFFFFNDTATTEIYTLSLHDALPISKSGLPKTDDSIVLHSMLALNALAEGDAETLEKESVIAKRDPGNYVVFLPFSQARRAAGHGQLPKSEDVLTRAEEVSRREGSSQLQAL